jgi:hypothetical protein
MASPVSWRRLSVESIMNHRTQGLEVTVSRTPNEALFRAAISLGRRRHADAVRIASAFTEFVATVIHDAPGFAHGGVATGANSVGSTVVEFRCPVPGIPSSFVAAYLRPIVEAHVANCLEDSRRLDANADLIIRVDASVTHPQGGTLLRVVLPAAGSPATPLARTEPPARRFESGVQFRDASLLDVEEALDFALRRSS